MSNERKPVLFLDIDGVLNDHARIIDFYCGINHNNLHVFNKIYRDMDRGRPDIVISSAWRYMMIEGAMTLDGFRYMMISHGFEGNIIGYTDGDDKYDGDRMQQIWAWMVYNRPESKFFILDDLPLQGPDCPYFYQTDGKKGLVPSDIQPILKKWRHLNYEEPNPS